jgi:hypothetical protein
MLYFFYSNNHLLYQKTPFSARYNCHKKLIEIFLETRISGIKNTLLYSKFPYSIHILLRSKGLSKFRFEVH